MMPPTPSRRSWPALAAVAVSFAGLFAAAVLALGHVLNLPIPCGGEHGCATVANHPSSRMFGVPIAFLGAAAYLVHLALLGRPSVMRGARIAAVVLTAAGTTISAGLLYYAHAVIQAHCLWCIASGVAMTSLLVLDVILLRSAPGPAGAPPAVVWALALVTAAGIGVQAGWMQRAAYAPPVAAARLATLGPTELIDPVKCIGPADAPVTVVIFADFWCPACRNALAALIRYQRAYPNTVRIAYRHLPLSRIRGHETSQAAAALSEMAGERGKFWTFTQAVHAEPRPMTREQYLQLMTRLGFGSQATEARLAEPSDRAVVQVRQDLALAERLGIQSTPTFVLKIASQPLVSASQRGLARLLDSPVVSALVQSSAAGR